MGNTMMEMLEGLEVDLEAVGLIPEALARAPAPSPWKRCGSSPAAP